MALWSAFLAGMIFEKRYPEIKPIVWWTIAITFGVPFAAGAVALICMMVIWPGVEMSKTLFQDSVTTGDSKWARRLSLIWCIGAGALLSGCIATAFVLTLSGVVANVKLWFIGLCWLVLMIPWVLIGLAGRWLFRRYKHHDEADQRAEKTH
jgi:hypothetical protein